MDEVLFIANHAFDCIGAKAAGMRTAFIDRRRRPFGATPHQPDLLVPEHDRRWQTCWCEGSMSQARSSHPA